MCDPVIVGGLMVASIAVSVMAAKQQADSSSASLQYQAAVATNNATIAGEQAQATTEAGNVAATNAQYKTAAMLSQDRAAAAASGIDPNSGSPLDVQQTTAVMGKENELTIRANYARQAWGYQVQGMSDVAQSQLDTAGSGWAQQAGTINEFNSVVGGAASIGSKYIGWQQQGLVGQNNNPVLT